MSPKPHGLGKNVHYYSTRFANPKNVFYAIDAWERMADGGMVMSTHHVVPRLDWNRPLPIWHTWLDGVKAPKTLGKEVHFVVR
jgi:hypothetical protein